LYILNKGPKGKVEFQDKSSAGRADIDNLDGLVRFETRGPKNDYSNTAKAIDNFSSLNLGPTKLAVSRRVILESSSVFSISFDENGQPGSIHANSSIAVDGEIVVRGDSSVKAGTYLILKSNKRVFGTFKKIHDPGFSNGLKAKLVYGAGDVHLIVGK
jgi:hypothetical protein